MHGGVAFLATPTRVRPLKQHRLTTGQPIHWSPTSKTASLPTSAVRTENEGRSSNSTPVGSVPTECLAMLDVLLRWPEILTGVVVLAAEMAEGRQWLVTTDREAALKHLRDLGGRDIVEERLADVLDRQYGGLAFLTTSV